MHDAGGDKIIVKRDADGQYVYFSVRRDDDNGSIGDFVQCRQICERGRVGPQRTTSQVGQAPVAVPAFPALCADQIARYASIGGQTNRKQLDLIRAACGHDARAAGGNDRPRAGPHLVAQLLCCLFSASSSEKK